MMPTYQKRNIFYFIVAILERKTFSFLSLFILFVDGSYASHTHPKMCGGGM